MLACLGGMGLALPGLGVMMDLPQLAERSYNVGVGEPRGALSSLPASFDAREVWPHCIHPVRDQGSCGSCWAFAATEVLSDRFCIASGGAVDVVLSPGDLLACEKLNLGCTCGSLPEWAWDYLSKSGTVADACVPYASGSGDTQKCSKGACTASGANATRFFARSNYTHCGSTLSPTKHVADIMQCVHDGPVDATFNVYADFKELAGKGPVYRKSAHAGAYQGLHSVKVIGWGTDANSTDYWLVQNSWGSAWGTEGGFFKIERGVDSCGFEQLMYTGDPRL